MTQNARVMTLWQLMCYGLLTTPVAMSGFALVIYIPTYYAVDLGLGLAAVGAIFMAGRVLDVVTDPVVGHLSDQTRSRFGPRLPWMVFGLPGFLAAAWLLLAPGEGVGLVYLTLVSAAFYLFYTIVDVPYSSIGLEISPDTHERSYLASSKAAFQIVGALLASLIPIAAASQMGVSLQLIAMVTLGLSVLALILFVAFVPRNTRTVSQPRIGLMAATRFAVSNRRFRWLIGTFFVIQGANALTAGLMVLFITHVIGVAAIVGPFFLILFASTALFLPVWVILSRRFSKRASWLVSMIVACLALALTTQMDAGHIVQLCIFGAILGAVFGCDAIMPTSMLADLVYEGETEDGTRRSATYLAIKNAVSKLTFVLPTGIAFPVLGLVGFDGAGSNTDAQIRMLVFFFAMLPIVLRLLAFFLLRRADLSNPSDPDTARA